MVLANSGAVLTHLRKIEDAANARLDVLLPVLTKSAGATEAMKAGDPMKWMGLMNACRAQAEEIIFDELIYNRTCKTFFARMVGRQLGKSVFEKNKQW